LQNNEELLSTAKSFDDVLLNFALVITANRSPPHNMLSKAFPCGWKSFRSLPTFYSEVFDDDSYILTEDLQLHPLSQAVLRTTKIATHNHNISDRRQPNPSEYYDTNFLFLPPA
jgi:hypothetical protein